MEGVDYKLQETLNHSDSAYLLIKLHDHGLVSGLLPQVEWPRPVFSGAVCREFKEAETHSPCLRDRELP